MTQESHNPTSDTNYSQKTSDWLKESHDSTTEEKNKAAKRQKQSSKYKLLEHVVQTVLKHRHTSQDKTREEHKD
jgi:hypothetical protein